MSVDIMSQTHFVSLADWQRNEIDAVLDRADHLKRELRDEGGSQVLSGRTLAMLFHKPSLRTRVSFEVGMTQLGGTALYLSEQEIGIGSREPAQDIARVLSGYVDGIMIRTFSHELIRDIAQHASVPVINGLDDKVHPCQILSDLLTVREEGFDLDGLAVAFIGDGNNVAHSWINAAALYQLDLRLAVPEGFDPDPQILAAARGRGARVQVTHDPGEAARGARVLYTDVWASMGQEQEAAERRLKFQRFTIDETLVSVAARDAIVLHCLPAHRGDEISESVLEGPRSRIFPEAANRLHAQKGLLATLMA